LDVDVIDFAPLRHLVRGQGAGADGVGCHGVAGDAEFGQIGAHAEAAAGRAEFYAFNAGVEHGQGEGFVQGVAHGAVDGVARFRPVEQEVEGRVLAAHVQRAGRQ